MELGTKLAGTNPAVCFACAAIDVATREQSLGGLNVAFGETIGMVFSANGDLTMGAVR